MGCLVWSELKAQDLHRSLFVIKCKNFYWTTTSCCRSADKQFKQIQKSVLLDIVIVNKPQRAGFIHSKLNQCCRGWLKTELNSSYQQNTTFLYLYLLTSPPSLNLRYSTEALNYSYLSAATPSFKCYQFLVANASYKRLIVWAHFAEWDKWLILWAWKINNNR